MRACCKPTGARWRVSMRPARWLALAAVACTAIARWREPFWVAASFRDERRGALPRRPSPEDAARVLLAVLAPCRLSWRYSAAAIKSSWVLRHSERSITPHATRGRIACRNAIDFMPHHRAPRNSSSEAAGNGRGDMREPTFVVAALIFAWDLHAPLALHRPGSVAIGRPHRARLSWTEAAQRGTSPCRSA